MIRYLDRIIFVLALTVYAPSIAAQSTSWTSSRTLTHTFDIGPVASEPERVGLHYDLRYEFNRIGADPNGMHLGLALAAAGFENMKRDEGVVSTVYLESSLLGRYYRSGDATPLEPQQQKRYLDLFEKDPEHLTQEEEAELNGLIARVTRNRRFFTFGGHHRYEYSRLTGAKQHALGAFLSGEIPYLHIVLGEVSRVTGTRDGYRQQPVRAYLGLDYVLADEAQLAGNEVGENFPRVRGQLAWSTLVLDRFVLRATWHADLVLNAPAAIKAADREFNNVLQLWLVFPVSQEAGVMVKYTAGRFAPDYRSMDELNLGLSISLH